MRKGFLILSDVQYSLCPRAHAARPDFEPVGELTTTSGALRMDEAAPLRLFLAGCSLPHVVERGVHVSVVV